MRASRAGLGCNAGTMIPSLLLAIALLVALTTLHVAVLMHTGKQFQVAHHTNIFKLNRAFLTMFAAHAVEMVLCSLTLALACEVLSLGALEGAPGTFANYVYFAFETYTTVGYGDVTMGGAAQVIAAAVALVGIVLTASSASVAFLAVQAMVKSRPGQASA